MKVQKSLWEYFYASTLLFVQKIQLIFAFIKRTFIGHFYESNIFFNSLLSLQKCTIRFGWENVSFKPRSAPGTELIHSKENF